MTHSSHDRTHLEYCVCGDTLDPGAVGSLLTLPTSTAWARGDKAVSPHSGTFTRQVGVWHYRTDDHVSSSDLRDHVAHFIGIAANRHREFAQLRDDPSFETSISLVVVGSEGAGGDAVEATALAQLCDLSSRIDFKYFTSEGE